MALCILLSICLSGCGATSGTNGTGNVGMGSGGTPFDGNWVILQNGQNPINAQLKQAGTAVSGSGTLADVSTDLGYAWLAELSGCSPSFSGTTSTATLNSQTVPSVSLTGCGANLPDGELTTGSAGEAIIETTDGSWSAFQPSWSNFSTVATLLVQAANSGGGGSQAMSVQISVTNNGDGTATVKVLPMTPAPWVCSAAFQDTGSLVGGAFTGNNGIKIQYINFPNVSPSRVITVSVTPTANCDDSDGNIYFLTGAF